VAVQDRKGRFIGGLNASSFTVHEDNVPQKLDMVKQEAVPATFVLLIDSSQSMGRRIDFVRDAARRLIDRLRPQDRVVVAPFSRTVGAITGPTDDRQTVTEAIDAIEARGGTAILDSLTGIATQLKDAEGRQAIVLLTDGYDEHSSGDVSETLDRIKNTHATLYVIGIGGVAGISLKGERFLRHLAHETGGKVFFPSRDHELAEVHELVAADVQHRYLISYTPSNQKVDGSWRQIRLETAESAYRVRTRTGYVAPAPPPIRPTLEFTVTDTGRQHLEISADDLLVTEDGVEQRVETFQDAVMPVSIVLALDSSGSMRKAAAAAMDAARGFIEALQPKDNLALMLFSDQPVFAHDLTTSRETSLESIGEYVASGGTALYDAVGDGLARLKRVPGRRVIVLVTDGRDENNAGTAPGSARTLDDVVRQIQEVDATIFTIGLGPRIDQAVMQRLAALSGGQAYFPAEVGTLPDDYRRILENLRRRYIVGYTSTNSNRDGAWRSVRIRTTTHGVVVTSRGGYFAPQW
jgi:Ca-activated chloride channel family protein